MATRLMMLLLCLLFMHSLSAQKSENHRAVTMAGYSSSDANPDSIIYEKYIAETGEWELYLNYRYYYDAEGFNIRCISLVRNYDNTSWINGWKEEYVKDASGNMVESVFYVWNKDSVDWIPERKLIYEYDNNRNLLRDFMYYWNIDHGEWVNAGKGIFTVNDAGLTTEDIFYNWIISDEIWIYDYKDEYNYNEDGNTTEIIGYSWIKETSEWNPENRNVFLWDENGFNPLITGYDWDEFAEVWTEDNKREFQFDQNGNKTLVTYYIRDSTGEEWEFFYRLEYSYNEEVQLSQDIYSEWNNELAQFVPKQRKNYFYHAQSTGIPENITNTDFILYPNPSTQFVRFKMTDPVSDQILFILYDMHGKAVITQNLSGSQYIDLSSIPAGTYIYKVNYSGRRKTGILFINK